MIICDDSLIARIWDRPLQAHLRNARAGRWQRRLEQTNSLAECSAAAVDRWC